MRRPTETRVIHLANPKPPYTDGNVATLLHIPTIAARVRARQAKAKRNQRITLYFIYTMRAGALLAATYALYTAIVS